MVVTPTLQKQHVVILDLCEQLTVALEKLKEHDTLENQKKVMTLVGSFVAKSLHHLATEDAHTYPIALASPDEKIAIRAYELKRDFGNLKAKIAAYRERFLIARNIGSWEVFTQETLLLIKMSKKRIVREEKELFSLFLKQPMQEEEVLTEEETFGLEKSVI